MEMLIMGWFIFYMVRFGFIEIFRKVSKHRGIFHSIPVGLIWGVSITVIMYLFFKLNPLISWIYGIMMSFGYIIHLILDEIYSVDLGNRRVKKSAGTALKLFKLKTPNDKIQYLIVYLILIYLFSMAPDISIVQKAIFSHDAWLNFKSLLLPYDGKWFIH
jgi:hypothetical protein